MSEWQRQQELNRQQAEELRRAAERQEELSRQLADELRREALQRERERQIDLEEQRRHELERQRELEEAERRRQGEGQQEPDRQGDRQADSGRTNLQLESQQQLERDPRRDKQVSDTLQQLQVESDRQREAERQWERQQAFEKRDKMRDLQTQFERERQQGQPDWAQSPERSEQLSQPNSPEVIYVAKMYAQDMASVPVEEATPQIALMQQEMGRLGWGKSSFEDRSYTLFLEQARRDVQAQSERQRDEPDSELLPEQSEQLSPFVRQQLPLSPEVIHVAKMYAQAIASIPAKDATPQIALIQQEMGRRGWGKSASEDRSYTVFLEYADAITPEELAAMRREALMALVQLGLDYYLTVGMIMLPAEVLAEWGAARVAVGLEELTALERTSIAVAEKVSERRYFQGAQRATGSSREIGLAGESALNRLTGTNPLDRKESQVREWVWIAGNRGPKLRITDAKTSIRHEAKNTRLALDARTRKQLAKDNALWLADGRELGRGQPFWHLFRGASKSVKDELKKRGFLFRDYTLPPGVH